MSFPQPGQPDPSAVPPSIPDDAPQSFALPPYGPPQAPYAGPGYGNAAQPQAPSWPYPPAAVEPVPPEQIIGPDHVPWRWYDVLGAAAPFILILLLDLVVRLTRKDTSVTTTATPTTTRTLVSSTILGIAVYAVIVLLIWAFSVHKYHVQWSALGIRRVPTWYLAAFVPILIGMYIAAAIVSWIVLQLFYGGNATNPQVKELTGGRGFSWTTLILALITASIVAPIVEELFFRGMLFGWMRTRWHLVPGVIGSAALFSLAHAIPLIFASIFVVGMTLAVVYEKTKSTLATMMLHSGFNTIGVVLVFIDLARK